MSPYCSYHDCEHQQQHQSQPQLQSQLPAKTELFNYDMSYYPHTYYPMPYSLPGYTPNSTAQGLGYEQNMVTSYGQYAPQLIPDSKATAPKEDDTLSRLIVLFENIRREYDFPGEEVNILLTCCRTNERNREMEVFMKKFVAWTEEVQAVTEDLIRQSRVKSKSPEQEAHELN